MALSWDGSGLVLLEQQLANLVSEQTTNPGSFGPNQAISTSYKQGSPSSAAAAYSAGTITVSQLIARLQACLQLAMSLPQ
jgi:hypothetical protein